MSYFAFKPAGDHQDGDDISSAVELTKPTQGATKIMIQALSQNVRLTLDGNDPTTSSGFQLAAGDAPLLIYVGEEATVKVIEEAATADLQYQWGY